MSTPLKLGDLPPIQKELIEALEVLFPDRCPDESMSDRAVWISAGCVKVIRKIRSEYERQNRNTAR